MSGLPYTGGFNSYMFDVSQYGVDMPQYDNTGEMMRNASGLAQIVPYIGPILSAMLNIGGTMMQNQQQEYFYNKYMSPSARMAAMRAAGINPNAAAQGISGSSAPNLVAASPTSAFSEFGSQIGQSANTALTADAIKAGIDKDNAQTELYESMNVEKQTTNKYLDKFQQAALDKLVSEGAVTKSQANMIAYDEYYHGAEAWNHYQQTCKSLELMSQQVTNLEQEYYNLLAQEYATMMAGDLSKAQINKVFSDINLNNAQIEEIAHRVEQIDASTLSIMQDISESKVRERLTRVQAQYQEKYLNIWNQSGYDMKSDVNTNVQGLALQGKYKQADKLLHGVGIMIQQQGNAEWNSWQGRTQNSLQALSIAAQVYGLGSIAGASYYRANQLPANQSQIMYDKYGGPIGVTKTVYSHGNTFDAR